MKWNYRVMYHHPNVANTEGWYAIHEVYYKEDGSVEGWAESASDTYCEDINDMQDMVDKMMQGTAKAVLDYNTGEEIYE